MSIDKKVFNLFFEENKHLLDYKPKEYGIDEDNFLKWINNYNIPELKSIASLFRKYTRYVSYSEYKAKIASMCADIRSKSINYDTVVLMINNLLDKSNFWVALLHYSLLQDIITNIVINDLKNYIPKKTDEKILGIICDDASYSGTQFIFNMGSIPKYMDIIISIPYMSVNSKQIIKFDQKNIFFSSEIEEFKTFKQNIENEDKKYIDIINKYKIKTNLHTIFFNHKLADISSIYQFVYAFGNILPNINKNYFKYTPLSLIKKCNLEIYKEQSDRKMVDDIQLVTGIDDMCPIPFYKLFKYRYMKKRLRTLEKLVEIMIDTI